VTQQVKRGVGDGLIAGVCTQSLCAKKKERKKKKANKKEQKNGEGVK